MEVATSTVQVWAALSRAVAPSVSPSAYRVDGEAPSGIRFQQGAWERRIEADRPDLPVKGLIELMDNNPIVCADEMSVPGPASTLALIALGPLLRAGAPLEPPSIAFSFEDSGKTSPRGWRLSLGRAKHIAFTSPSMRERSSPARAWRSSGRPILRRISGPCMKSPSAGRSSSGRGPDRPCPGTRSRGLLRILFG